MLLQEADKSLYILLHGLAGRVPDAVATYCTLIRHMVGSMPSTTDPLTILRAMYPFAPSHSLVPIAAAMVDKQNTPDQVKQGLALVLVSKAFSGEELRHRRFCEVRNLQVHTYVTLCQVCGRSSAATVVVTICKHCVCAWNGLNQLEAVLRPHALSGTSKLCTYLGFNKVSSITHVVVYRNWTAVPIEEKVNGIAKTSSTCASTLSPLKAIP